MGIPESNRNSIFLKYEFLNSVLLDHCTTLGEQQEGDVSLKAVLSLSQSSSTMFLAPLLSWSH